MRVLTFANTVGLRSGGVGDVVQNLVYYHNKLDCHSDLWFAGDKARFSEVSAISNIDPMHLIPFTFLGKPDFGFLPLLLFKRKSVAQNYDLVHQHGLFLTNSIFINSLRGIKKVISPHGFLEAERLLISKRKKELAFHLYEKANLKHCDCLVACSEQEALGFRNFGLKQPIALLPNGVNQSIIERNDTTSNTFRAKNKIDEKKRILLFLSRIHPIKGLELLIESLSDVREVFESTGWVLVIAGIDEGNYQQLLEKKVQVEKLSSIVRFVGPQYGKHKFDAFDASNCFILPSLNENFGIVVIEALARGIPVITTKRTPWKDLETFNCGWWIERNRGSIAKALNELIQTKPRYLSQMGVNGKNLVTEKYQWASIAKQSIALYKWVINDFNEEFKSGFKLYEG